MAGRLQNAPRQREITQTIYDAVLRGELAPGERMPSHIELKERFGVAIPTLQRALRRLKRGGVIRAGRGSGTFVSERPPCLHTIGLAFPGKPGGHWSLFWEAVRRAAVQMQSRSNWRFPTYFGLSGDELAANYGRLQADLETFQLGGVLFAAHPGPLGGAPLLAAECTVPRVALSYAVPSPGIGAVYPDFRSFTTRALEHLRARDRRRVAAITIGALPRSWVTELEKGMRQAQLAFEPYWLQGVPLDNPRWAANCVHALMAASPGKRPDALIVTDDHLLPGVIEGLRAAGVRIRQDLDVVALRNWPTEQPAEPGVCYLGFEADHVLCTCLEMLRRRAQSEDGPDCVLVPAVFENELDRDMPLPVAWCDRGSGIGTDPDHKLEEQKT